jgi:hypothetical protein
VQEDSIARVPSNCTSSCGAEFPLEELNRSCYCLSVDKEALHRALEQELAERALSDDMMTMHANLFAAVPMFVSRAHLEQMSQVIRAVEAVVATIHYQRAATAWAPEIARFNPGSRGGLLGFDFHLSVSGPKLIEINTNPGGVLLNALLSGALRSCCREVTALALTPVNTHAIERAVLDIFLSEWRLQRHGAPLKSVAIVDETPTQQYLYPEFRLYENLFSSNGIKAFICAPHELSRKGAQLWIGETPIDFVYNRLTDFAFEHPSLGILKSAYLAGEAVVSPQPRAHALYADKRNLTLLCNEAFLRGTQISEQMLGVLMDAIPNTQTVCSGNRDALWEKRRSLFFKPAAGYGGKATYRGDKITKRVWEEMKAGCYVAQALIAPSERRIMASQSSTALKADVRNYAYAGEVKLVAARLYQGQTTNFRTPGGGFAPVFTER